MFNRIKKAIKNNKGFTLVELIVVIAILGILAAIAIPRLGGFQTNAKANADATNTKNIQNAVEIYEAEKGSYPAAAADITTLINDYLGGEVPSPKADTTKKFIYTIGTHKVSIGTAVSGTSLAIE